MCSGQILLELCLGKRWMYMGPQIVLGDPILLFDTRGQQCRIVWRSFAAMAWATQQTYYEGFYPAQFD